MKTPAILAIYCDSLWYRYCITWYRRPIYCAALLSTIRFTAFNELCASLLGNRWLLDLLTDLWLPDGGTRLSDAPLLHHVGFLIVIYSLLRHDIWLKSVNNVANDWNVLNYKKKNDHDSVELFCLIYSLLRTSFVSIKSNLLSASSSWTLRVGNLDSWEKKANQWPFQSIISFGDDSFMSYYPKYDHQIGFTKSISACGQELLLKTISRLELHLFGLNSDAST